MPVKKAKRKKLVPEIKKTIKSFLIEDRGSISKHKMLTLGAFLGSISILNLLPEVAAAHSNSFKVSWNSGNITAQHGHHASHASHSSHSSHSSHGSHSSHSSHGSHSSHSSHGSHSSHSSHGSHSSHSSHGSHGSHSSHGSHASHYSSCDGCSLGYCNYLSDYFY
jgi:hypothetical protein